MGLEVSLVTYRKTSPWPAGLAVVLDLSYQKHLCKCLLEKKDIYLPGYHYDELINCFLTRNTEDSRLLCKEMQARLVKMNMLGDVDFSLNI